MVPSNILTTGKGTIKRIANDVAIGALLDVSNSGND